MQIGKSLFQSKASFSAISRMQQQMEKLSVQLATGERASTLSELGNNRTFDLTLRARLNRIEAYNSSIDTVNLRLDFYDNAMTRLDELEADARSTVASGVGPDGINMASAQSLAQARLDEVLTILNSEINGRHMFGGGRTDSRPVEYYNVAMNGDATRDGFSTVAAEFKSAHLGASNNGRLVSDISTLVSGVGGTPNIVTLAEKDAALFPYGSTIDAISTTSAGSIAVSAPAGVPPQSDITFTTAPTPPAAGEQIQIDVTTGDGNTVTHTFTAVAGTPTTPYEFEIGLDEDETAANFKTALDAALSPTTLTLAEDGAHTFGMKLKDISSTSANIVTTDPAGAPQMEALRLTGQPDEGETIDFEFVLPDGRVSTITLTAVSETPYADGQFQIGADVQTTLGNIQAELDAELQRVGATELTSAALYQAADNFFNGRGETVMRVDGPPFETATGLVAASATDTVFWYNGEDDPNSPRSTVTARVDDATTVKYGVQGNESGMVSLVRSLAVLAVDNFPAGDDNSSRRFEAIAKEQAVRLAESNNSDPGSIEIITLELGVARATLGSAGERHISYSNQLETMLSEIESVPIEETAMMLLNLQTQLQASYQTMGILSELTLVNYMR